MKSNTVSYAMDKRDNMISFRLNDEELSRVNTVIKNALGRNRYITKADVYREMLGVAETGVITANERTYLLTGDEAHLQGRRKAEETHRKTNSGLVIAPPKKGMENIFDFVEMVQRDYPELTELEILDIRSGRTEDIDPRLVEIVLSYVEKEDLPKDGTRDAS